MKRDEPRPIDAARPVRLDPVALEIVEDDAIFVFHPESLIIVVRVRDADSEAFAVWVESDSARELTVFQFDCNGIDLGVHPAQHDKGLPRLRIHGGGVPLFVGTERHAKDCLAFVSKSAQWCWLGCRIRGIPHADRAVFRDGNQRVVVEEMHRAHLVRLANIGFVRMLSKAPRSLLETPRPDAAERIAERDALAVGRVRHRPKRVGLLFALGPLCERMMHHLAGAAFQHGDVAGFRPKTGDGDVFVLVVGRQRQRENGAALFAPDTPAQHLHAFGLKLAVAIRPHAHHLVVADGEGVFAVLGELQTVAGADAAAWLDDQFGILSIAATVLREHRSRSQ